MAISLDDYGVYFHGTREESAAMIRKDGFNTQGNCMKK